MTTYYKGKNVLVTGGAGFVGSHLVEKLVEAGAIVRVAGRRKNTPFLKNVINKVECVNHDLLDLEECVKVAKDQDIVFNLAAVVGGVHYNVKHAGMLYYVNSTLGKNVLEGARINDVDEFQCVSSACVYAREATVPNIESEGFMGEPEKTNLGYGWGKRASELAARLYAEEYGMKVSIVRPFNMYGPRDDFNPETSHVIPALIKKVVEAEDKVMVWGSGRPTRAFVYVKDAAEGLLLAHEKYATADPLNIGTDEETGIKEIIKTLIDIDGRNLGIEHDLTKPEGQQRRAADVTKMKRVLNWKPSTPLKQGLEKTMNWYKQNIIS